MENWRQVWGYSLDCTIENNRINGRFGGAVIGNDVQLELSPEEGRLWGRIGGGVIGKDLNIYFEVDKASGRLGGPTIGDDISLHGTEKITGRVGGAIIGFNCNIDVSPISKADRRLAGLLLELMLICSSKISRR